MIKRKKSEQTSGLMRPMGRRAPPIGCIKEGVFMFLRFLEISAATIIFSIPILAHILLIFLRPKSVTIPQSYVKVTGFSPNSFLITCREYILSLPPLKGTIQFGNEVLEIH